MPVSAATARTVTAAGPERAASASAASSTTSGSCTRGRGMYRRVTEQSLRNERGSTRAVLRTRGAGFTTAGRADAVASFLLSLPPSASTERCPHVTSRHQGAVLPRRSRGAGRVRLQRAQHRSALQAARRHQRLVLPPLRQLAGIRRRPARALGEPPDPATARTQL